MEDKIEAYCCRCKHKREMKDMKMTKTKRGVDMMCGKCIVCDCKMCRIGG